MVILSNGHQWKYSEFLDNKDYSFDKDQILKSISKDEIDDAYNSISKWEGYAPTPLILLNKLSNELSLKNIFYKDEDKRFDLKSFKALGGAYAVEKVTKGDKDIVVATATAGNHGRSVAWGARRLGLKCKIFISEFVSKARGQAMADLGADVIKVKGNYEKSLLECIKQSTENNWQIVQDVAWKDYMLVPKYTMAGYSVMMREIVDQINNEKITHIILQAGVGGMAGAMIAGIARYLDNIPITIVVEPDSAACVLESIRTGKVEKIDIKRESLMGGMSCGEVSLVPWEILKYSVKHCISLPDDDIGNTMKLLGNSSFSDQKIIAGENSAPGVISLIASCEDQNIKKKLQLDQNSNVLIFGCEGDTDKEMYQKLISQ
ncbi:putatiave diaminopropionate ammonia lyase [Candidatus Pelagibacter sp. HTCC7211]|jgi:diaminopropionate ammonia-lyase|uniref:diaminopropionate ammonia-lyase n=1 Tax=Pelagibacter sp. (strain HTCC7211) TaxID=439493 RepID=UPI000183B6FD|nr:diaminopropionate ammonia-lyase [Candidatus Pelagibacter sp. HTCC7211]EDZ60667.1 putatiave diaminopropionate ammonia lyase [Candidatus Pelagibacter sp. HTCC7211]